MNEHVFVGFGFGPIQGGLFAAEAFESGHFKRIVIVEIDPKLVDAICADNGRYAVNVASSSGIKTEQIDGIEIYNPTVEGDRRDIIQVLSQATEIVTSLPSVKFYDMGEHSVAALIALGLKNRTADATIIYTAENNNHAAEILQEKVREKLSFCHFRAHGHSRPSCHSRAGGNPAAMNDETGSRGHTISIDGVLGEWKGTVQFLNTVIGKMSQVVTDKDEIAEKNLKPIAPNIDRAFLVEEFNRILVTKCTIPGFKPGIEVFIEKEDLLPFEEAKLYGHNAIHALLAYLGVQKGYRKMAELENDAEIMQIARDAFIRESGAALVKKYAHLNDALFTPEGFWAYADDLLKRMTNPWLGDSVQRAARDPQRKLSENDRIFGTIKLAMEQGIKPMNFAKGALAGLEYYKGRQIKAEDVDSIITELWQSGNGVFKFEMIKLIEKVLSISLPL